jgi:hypothetical protein
MRDGLCKFHEEITDMTALEGVGLLMGHRLGVAITKVEQGEDPTSVVFSLLDELGTLMASVPSNRVTPALLHAAMGRGLKEESS